MTKIGFDFEKAIGEVENEKPYQGCYNILKMIVDKLGSENVYIISKSTSGNEITNSGMAGKYRFLFSHWF